MTANVITSDALGSTSTPNASMTPIRMAARSAPGTEPIPPITTTTNASVMIVVSITMVSGWRGTCSAPPSPANAAPSANTAVKSRAWSTPRAATISRSCVAARMSTPHRVRWNSHQSPSATSGPTTISARS